MAAILVVDANAPERRVVRMTLEVDGHWVSEAASGQEAFQELSARPADVVLLALDLPSEDGYKVLSDLRMIPGREDTTVITMVSPEDERGPVESFVAGAIDVLVRPFGAQELRGAVERTLTPEQSENRRSIVDRQLDAYELAQELQEKARARD